LLLQAKLWMERDPTIAIAWLKQYARTPIADPGEIATVAADGESRWVARERWVDRRRVALSADGRRFAAMRDDELVTWSLSDPTPRVVARPDGAVTAVVLPNDGDGVLVADGGRVRLWRDGRATEKLSGTEPVSALGLAGRSVIVGGEHGSVWILAEDGTVRHLPGDDSPINDLVSARDGATVLAHSKANTMRVLRVAEGKQETLPPVDRHPSDAKHATLSPDGTRVAWGDDEGNVAVRELATAHTRSYLGHKGQIQRVLFSPDGTHLATTAADRSVRVWDLASGRAQVLNGHGNWSQRLAFSPDGRLLASTGLDRTVRLWNLANGDSQRLLGHDGSVTLLAFSADGHDLIVGETQGELRVWPVQASSGRVLHVPPGLTQFATYRSDGMLIVADETGTHYFFDDAGKLDHRDKVELVHSPVGVPEMASHDGRLIAIGSGDGKLVIFDSVAGTTRVLPGHDGLIYDLRFSRDARHLVSGGADHTVRLWDLEHGTQRVVGRHPLPVWHTVLSPDEQLLATAGDDLDLRLWSLTREAQPQRLNGHTGLVYQLEFAPDGKTLASAGLDTTIRLWNVSDGSARTMNGHRGLVQALAFSPDGTLLASGADDHTVRLWPMAGGDARVLPHGAGITHLRFLPGGAWLVSGDAEGTVRVWDVQRASLRAIYRGSAAAVVDLAVRNDGKRIAASMEDGAVRVWDDPTEGPLPPTTAEALGRLGSVEIVDGVAVSYSTQLPPTQVPPQVLPH
jgi:WD40 repeat protein